MICSFFVQCEIFDTFYQFQTADMGITEHIEGDECKFAAWTGRSPVVENKMILKVMRNYCMVKEGDKNLPDETSGKGL